MGFLGEMNYIISSLAVVSLSVANWIFVFVYGFGVKVENWWVVIGCGVFANVIISAMRRAVEKEGNEKGKQPDGKH